MGGLAFSSGAEALYTPRMPTSIYRQMRDKCHAALRKHFVHVATPVEGPAKEDHGDIDILVAIEKNPTGDRDSAAQSPSSKQRLVTIQQALNSKRAIINSGISINVAIPWPSDNYNEAQANNGEFGIKDKQSVREDTKQPRFIQVDVRICETVEKMQWFLFKHAHGDIWNLLGSTIRPFGLTIDEVGLYIRIPQIEDHNRKLAKVFLTDNTSEVLRFIGLKENGYWDKPFATMEDLFEYVASCKLFWVKPEAEEGESGSGIEEEGSRTAGITEAVGQEVGEEGKNNLRSNDRRRMAQRPVFRKWVDEFIPECRARGRFVNTDPEMTKERVRERMRAEAFACFPGVEQEYETRLREWLKEKSKEAAWNSAIKGTVPEDLEPQRRGNLVTALKKIILRDDDSFGITPEHPLKTPDGFYLIEDIRKWVSEHWQEVYEVAWQRQLERAREAMAAKKKKAEELEVKAGGA